MELRDILSGLSAEKGVRRVEVAPDDLCDAIVTEESTVKAAGGSMEVDNTGLDDIMDRNTRIIAFVDPSFICPSGTSMRMVDDNGTLIGHDIDPRDSGMYKDRPDVTFLSDDFVMYNNVDIVGGTSMIMLARPYRGGTGWIPEEYGSIIWFSSTTSSMMIHRHFAQPVDDLATAMIGLNI